jgi:hypothetical protein
VDSTHWTINSADGSIHDVITLNNGASIHVGKDHVGVAEECGCGGGQERVVAGAPARQP